MKKTFDLEDLDCAVCANKMETEIKKINGVYDANVSFLTQKLTLEANDENFDAILKQVVKICKKVEPDCTIKLK
jgi:copper chaperone CopZ